MATDIATPPPTLNITSTPTPTTTTTTTAARATNDSITTPDVTTPPVETTTPTEAPTTTASRDPGGADVPIGAVVGGLVGGLVGLIIIVVIIVVVVRKCRTGKDDCSDDDDDDDDDDTPPQPLPKLDEHGRVVRDPDDVISHPVAAPHSPAVYEDPNQPSTMTQIRDKRGSESHHYGNIPLSNDSSSGAYIVPLDHRPVGSPPISPAHHTNGGLKNPCFEWNPGNSAEPGEEPYMPMDLSNPTHSEAKGGGAGGSVYTGSDPPKPSPCTVSKKEDRYVNVPHGKPPSAQKGGYQNYPEDKESHHYGNVPDLAGVKGSALSSPDAPAPHGVSTSAQPGWIPLPTLPDLPSRPSPRPGLKVAPKPSPKPSPKQLHNASVNSSPKPSPKPLRVDSPKPSPKPLRVDSPKPSPKPSPSAKLAGVADGVPSVHRPESDSESEGENYENLKGPEQDYVNAPEKHRNYVNAPGKKSSK